MPLAGGVHGNGRFWKAALPWYNSFIQRVQPLGRDWSLLVAVRFTAWLVLVTLVALRAASPHLAPSWSGLVLMAATVLVEL